MLKKVSISYMLIILSLGIKAQNWAPLDTGIKSFIPWGLMADNNHGNLFAFGNKFGIGGLDVWRNNQWELWYPNIEFGSYGDERVIYNDTIVFFKRFFGTPTKTTILRFTNSSDLDTLKTLQNHSWLPYLNCIYNGKLLLGAVSTTGINSIASFDGDTIIPFGDPTISGINSACVYNGSLYAHAFLTDGFRGIIKYNLSLTSYQKIYQIYGSMSSIAGMLVYNNRLYIYGGIYLAESSANLGNNIIAYDGVNFDTLNGGVINQYNTTNGGVNDAVVCNGKLFVTGNFSKAGGANAKGFAYWNDTTWCTSYKDLDSTGNFFRLECFKDTIYEVAEFYSMHGVNLGWLAKFQNMNYVDTCSAPYYVSVNELNSNYSINVYPNPTTSIINISSEQNLQNATIQITNTLGQTLLQMPFNEKVDVSMLLVGMYFLSIESNNIKKTIKIIKQ